jgi:hypothetical protein
MSQRLGELMGDGGMIGPKRKPGAYAMFVKKNYKKVKKLPASERFAAIGRLWKSRK